jgi:hypothetical protein
MVLSRHYLRQDSQQHTSSLASLQSGETGIVSSTEIEREENEQDLSRKLDIWRFLILQSLSTGNRLCKVFDQSTSSANVDPT